MAPGPLYSWVRQRARRTTGSTRRAWTAPGYESGVRLADPSDEEGRKIVTELLLDLRDPGGRRIVKSVESGHRVYPGANAPDLLCTMEDESINLHEGLHAPTPWVSREAEPWGTHATRGVVAIQDAVSTDLQGNAADICPTVLALLGLQAEGLDGSSLVNSKTLTSVAVDSMRGDDSQKEAAYSEDQEAAVLEQLRGLGYVE
jgi:predicted AlkP superfamily phosphohydrolase/phosphomutase